MMRIKKAGHASLGRAAFALTAAALLAACAAKEPLKECEAGVSDISNTATLVPGNC
ncbi:MAG: hypothetical protein KDE00_02150 [Rhodobacteraceae bacterium]|nr:hypothetical protein [Paracoccaceae bacterium]